jgi:hypothetical protein
MRFGLPAQNVGDGGEVFSGHDAVRSLSNWLVKNSTLVPISFACASKILPITFVCSFTLSVLSISEITGID